jgi:hypothetical protein
MNVNEMKEVVDSGTITLDDALELLEKWTEFYANGMDPEDTHDLYVDTLAVLG